MKTRYIWSWIIFIIGMIYFFLPLFALFQFSLKMVKSPAPSVSILDYMVGAGLATSKSDARRKIEQGGVSVDGKKVNSTELILNSEDSDGKVIKVGKINFRKIVF